MPDEKDYAVITKHVMDALNISPFKLGMMLDNTDARTVKNWVQGKGEPQGNKAHKLEALHNMYWEPSHKSTTSSTS